MSPTDLDWIFILVMLAHRDGRLSCSRLRKEWRRSSREHSIIL